MFRQISWSSLRCRVVATVRNCSWGRDPIFSYVHTANAERQPVSLRPSPHPIHPPSPPASAFGQRRRPRMTFHQLKRLCIAHHHTNRHAAASAAAVSVIEGASHLADLCRRWDVDSLNEMELRSLLGTIRSIARDDIHSLEESERKYCKDQIVALRHESVEALFWDDLGVLELEEEFELSRATRRGGGSGVGIGEGQTAVDWRKARMQEVERRAGRLESAARAVAFSADAVEAAVASSSSGGSRLGLASGKFLRDALGHGFGHRHGIFAIVGSLDEAVTSSSSSSSSSSSASSSSSTSTGRSRIPVEVVCVPRGLPSHARRSVEICAHAHRQLSLSPRFPNYLGCVTHYTSGEGGGGGGGGTGGFGRSGGGRGGGGEGERLTCFCYEHARMVPLRELLKRGGRLDECGWSCFVSLCFVFTRGHIADLISASPLPNTSATTLPPRRARGLARPQRRAADDIVQTAVASRPRQRLHRRRW